MLSVSWGGVTHLMGMGTPAQDGSSGLGLVLGLREL